MSTRAILNPYFDLFEKLKEQPAALQLELRKKLIWAYSWAVPSPRAVEAIRTHSPLIEIGAGSGYWAWLLVQAGADIVAFDQEPDQPPHWYPVRASRKLSMQNGQDRTLFLCWPPDRSEMATEALRGYSGRTVIYVGEWKGRTADASFHAELERSWNLTENLELPNWPGYSDRLHIFQRRE